MNGTHCLDGSQVRDTGQIHRFLNGMACQHADAGLAACINVLVVAEDVQRTGMPAHVQHTCITPGRHSPTIL